MIIINHRKLSARFAHDEHASTGPGSTIFFVALISVAGVTSTLLMGVAVDLDNQARTTSSDALASISAGLEVVSVSGDRNRDGLAGGSPEETIQVLQVVVRPGAGSQGVDLARMVVSVSDARTTAVLRLNASGSNASHADASTYVYTALRDLDGSLANHILNDGDLIQLYISCDSDATALDLGPATQFSLKLLPSEGSSVENRFTTPSSYRERTVEVA